MTDHEYLKHMFHLTVRLTDAVNNFGYRSDVYNNVLNEIAASAARFNRRRHIRHCVTVFGCIALILFVLYLACCYVAEGFVK